MFADNILKTDPMRREKAVKPQPAARAGWMGTGMSPPPAPNTDLMMQILQGAPGMTPELLRQILEDQKNKMAPPVMDPRAIVGATNYRNPL